MKTLLLVLAHPDDESFACGGTIAKYAERGCLVHLICATRGEAGSFGSYKDLSGEELGDIRQKELETSGTMLGITSVTFLGYKDGVLAGQHSGELEDKIYRQMTVISPDVVITFEPNGISNHPDHSKICLSTTFAFQKYAADMDSLKNGAAKLGQRAKKSFEQVSSEHEQIKEPKLYYACMPESVAAYLKKQKNIPAESFGKSWIGISDKFVTTVIDIDKYRTEKMKALKAHVSQQIDVDRFLSLSTQPLLRQEYFILHMQGIHEVFMGRNDRVAHRL